MDWFFLSVFLTVEARLDAEAFLSPYEGSEMLLHQEGKLYMHVECSLLRVGVIVYHLLDDVTDQLKPDIS